MKNKLKSRIKNLSAEFTERLSEWARTFGPFSSFRESGAIMIFISTVIICTVILVTYTIKENSRLRENISRLYELNIEQNNLILAKSVEIDSLKSHDETVNNLIMDFLQKYRIMTDNYITSRVDANRSGDRTVSREKDAFANDINELKELLINLKDLNNSVDKELADLSDVEDKLKEYLDSIPTLRPLSGRVTSPFGGRRDPFAGRKTFHEGIDYAASYGQAIKASADGVVTLSQKYSGYGLAVVIDHGYGITTLYAHCSGLLVKEGQSVKKGDIIAKAGSTGKSTGPHLHFEIRINGEPVDPAKYLED